METKQIIKYLQQEIAREIVNQYLPTKEGWDGMEDKEKLAYNNGLLKAIEVLEKEINR